jgi:hypothetical protein
VQAQGQLRIRRIDPELRVKRASAKRAAHSGVEPTSSSYVMAVKKQLNNA